MLWHFQEVIGAFVTLCDPFGGIENKGEHWKVK
jgi:hypothetical protein